MEKILITLCAREGSKRLKNKHIRPFCGKSLLEWSIIQALRFQKQRQLKCKSSYIKIICCTDIFYIMDIQKKYENLITFIDQPKSEGLGLDDTPKLEVIQYIINKNENYWDYLIDLDVTSPLRRISDIENALNLFIAFNCQTSLFSVTHARRHPFFNQVKWNDILGEVSLAASNNDANEYYNFYQENHIYDMNASIYIYDINWLSDGAGTISPITKESRLYLMEEWQAFDVNTLFDFKLVEAIFKAKGLDKNDY